MLSFFFWLCKKKNLLRFYCSTSFTSRSYFVLYDLQRVKKTLQKNLWTRARCGSVIYGRRRSGKAVLLVLPKQNWKLLLGICRYYHHPIISSCLKTSFLLPKKKKSWPRNLGPKNRFSYHAAWQKKNKSNQDERVTFKGIKDRKFRRKGEYQIVDL